MKQTRIALVQMKSLMHKRDDNINKIKEYTKEAGKNNCHIICFPETSIHGYSKNLYLKSAETIPSVVEELQPLSDEYGICILVGMAEKAVDNKKPYITHLAIMPESQVGIYRKTHLGSSEKPYFSPGNDVPIFKTSTATIGIQICWDLHFPELSTIMSLNGAEIIFAPHASPTIVGDRRKIWLKYLTARAYDNATFLAACNLIGRNGDGQEFCGGALVIDPKGNVIAQDFNGHESILYADLDHEMINRIRNSETKTMKDRFYLQARRPELYKKLYYNKPTF